MKIKAHKIKKRQTFKEAVEATVEVRLCYQAGKHAIKHGERNKVELIEPKKCGGSLFIDQCLIDQKKYAQDNRWDYAIDYNGEVFFFEVHTASSKEVSTVIRKLNWLKAWLHDKAPNINSLRAQNPFYWIQSSGYHILPNSSHLRLVNQNGIKPIPKLVLPIPNPVLNKL